MTDETEFDGEPDDLAPDASRATREAMLERVASFVSDWRLKEQLEERSPSAPVWLAVATRAEAQSVLMTLTGGSRRVQLLEMQHLQEGSPETAYADAIAAYATNYTDALATVLGGLRDQVLGLLVVDDREPFVRHLVYCCKGLGIRTVLLPGLSLASTQEVARTGQFASWNQPSGYALPPLHLVDSPVADCIFAYTEEDRAAWLALGYPKKRVRCLNVPFSALTKAATDSRFIGTLRRLTSVRLRAATQRFWELLDQQSAATFSPFDPGYKKSYFSGHLETFPCSSLVAYHREIDEGSAYVPSMLGFRRLFSPSNFASAQQADAFAAWGGLGGEHRKTRLKRWAKRLKRPHLLLEDGLFRSVEIGLTGTPTLSILLDDKRAYYDATGPSRLEELLNSPREFGTEELTRAERCMMTIAQRRLSKYNHAPDHEVPFGPGAVLVVDQRKGDLSVEKGLGSEACFHEMLLAALRENPGCQVLIKRHPDAMSGGKSSYYSNDYLERLGPLPKTHLIDYEVNPHALFDVCKTVYVVSSGMGFEAAIRGLEVRCFGVPFYAGWGITHDEQSVPRRTRKRSLAEAFYATCILHSRYFSPRAQAPCNLEDLLEYLAEARDARSPVGPGSPK